MSQERKKARTGAGAKAEENLDKVRSKLQEHIQQGQYYEAQQLYQTLYNRMCAKKEYNDAAKLMMEGAVQLLEYKQGNAGGELANRLIECYTKSDIKQSNDHIDNICKIFDLFGDNREAKITFMKNAIKWSCKAGSNPHGDARLHYEFAKYLTQIEDYASAQRHWLRSSHPEEHATCLIVWCKKGFKGERDLYVTRAVLQYLCLENLDAANKMLLNFMAAFSSEADSLQTPLVNFTKFLLKTIERDAAPLFEMLRQKYASSIARDPNFISYLDQIGEIYYKIPAPKGLLEDLLSLVKS